MRFVKLDKNEFIHRIVSARNKIEQLIENLPEEKLNEIKNQSGWSIKTLIAHLTFWERATLDCHCGSASPESLKDVPAINAALVSRTNSRTSTEVVHEFHHHGAVLIEELHQFTDDQMTGPAPWKDDKQLWEHLADDTIVHYEEHEKTLRTWCNG
jgi:hemerythrin superfamily protein